VSNLKLTLPWPSPGV